MHTHKIHRHTHIHTHTHTHTNTHTIQTHIYTHTHTDTYEPPKAPPWCPACLPSSLSLTRMSLRYSSHWEVTCFMPCTSVWSSPGARQSTEMMVLITAPGRLSSKSQVQGQHRLQSKPCLKNKQDQDTAPQRQCSAPMTRKTESSGSITRDVLALLPGLHV